VFIVVWFSIAESPAAKTVATDVETTSCFIIDPVRLINAELRRLFVQR
jgi:hypothetical protein